MPHRQAEGFNRSQPRFRRAAVVVLLAAAFSQPLAASQKVQTATATDVTSTADAGPTITVSAPVPNVLESGRDYGTFTITRSLDLPLLPLAVSYTVTGTATPSADYSGLPGTVTFPEGSAAVTIPAVPINDTIVEEDETVILTLAPSTTYVVGSPGSATVTIKDDETAGTEIQLMSGVTYSDVIKGESSQSAWKYYWIDVPAGATALQALLDNYPDNVNLYVQASTKPTLASAPCMNGSCTFSSPAAGTWWIAISNVATGVDIAYRLIAVAKRPVTQTLAASTQNAATFADSYFGQMTSHSTPGVL